MALNVQSPEIVQKLLSKDKDVLLDTDAEGWSPLHFSSELGDLKSTKLFVENGADPNYTCQNKTALDLAHYNEKWEIVSYLRTLTKKEVDPNYKKPIERKIEDITE
jgi:ankyrin repeat protein